MCDVEWGILDTPRVSSFIVFDRKVSSVEAAWIVLCMYVSWAVVAPSYAMSYLTARILVLWSVYLYNIIKRFDLVKIIYFFLLCEAVLSCHISLAVSRLGASMNTTRM